MKAIQLTFVIAGLCIWCLNSGAQDNSFLTNGLVAFYTFSGNVNDYSGNHLDFTGLTAFVNDRFNAPQSAALFNSPNTITTANVALGTNGFSVSLWLFLNRTPNTFGERILIAGATPYGNGPDEQSRDLFSIAVWGDGRGGINVVDANNTGHDINASSGTFTTNKWYQMVFCADGTNVNFTLNGTLVSSLPESLRPINEHLALGGDPGLYFVSGAVDEIRIYNRALSKSEVQQLYQFETGPHVGLLRAVIPAFSNLTIGTNYQLQLSDDMATWTNQGSAFTATNVNAVYPQYWNVDNWQQLFFRLQAAP